MTNFSHYNVNASMITMNSPITCLATRLNYKLNSMHKLLLTSEHLVQEARRNSYPSGDIQFYSRQFNVDYLPTVTQGVKQLA